MSPMPEAARDKSARSGRWSAWACCATSTSRCICRCATRTRPASSPIGTLRDGDTAQVEGVVTDSRVETRCAAPAAGDAGRRQRRRCCCASCTSTRRTQKQLAVGQRVRVRGEVRGGFLGREMVHPTVKVVEADTPLPAALTPVYPTSAQLPQAYLRKAVAVGAGRARRWTNCCRPAPCPPACRRCARRCWLLHHPPPGVALAALEDRSHPAWQRLKFDELLAQQLSQLQAQHARARAAGADAARRPRCRCGCVPSCRSR